MALSDSKEKILNDSINCLNNNINRQLSQLTDINFANLQDWPLFTSVYTPEDDEINYIIQYRNANGMGQYSFATTLTDVTKTIFADLDAGRISQRLASLALQGLTAEVYHKVLNDNQGISQLNTGDARDSYNEMPSFLWLLTCALADYAHVTDNWARGMFTEMMELHQATPNMLQQVLTLFHNFQFDVRNHKPQLMDLWGQLTGISSALRLQTANKISERITTIDNQAKQYFFIQIAFESIRLGVFNNISGRALPNVQQGDNLRYLTEAIMMDILMDDCHADLIKYHYMQALDEMMNGVADGQNSAIDPQIKALNQLLNPDQDNDSGISLKDLQDAVKNGRMMQVDLSGASEDLSDQNIGNLMNNLIGMLFGNDDHNQDNQNKKPKSKQ